jgi:sirohydrochlorin cobaltochelatase
MHGILLFAHGARDPAWSRPFEAIAQHMRQTAQAHRVSLAYLELMQPSLPDAADVLVEQGCTRITVVPVFLGAGGHVKRDLPALLAALRARHPQVQVDATCAIGESPDVIAALAEAALRLAQAGTPAA